MKRIYLSKNKKAQGVFGLSFSVIFSIFLIIFFVIIAFIVIKSFLGTQKCAQVALFKDDFQNEIKKAEHLVFVYPNWWGTYPALLKGFIDRVFLPKFAFKIQEKSPLPEKLLKGKSARLIVTMDTPLWYYNLIYKKSGHNSMKKSILNFCGIKPVKITAFEPIKSSTEEKRKLWLNKVEKLGELMK